TKTIRSSSTLAEARSLSDERPSSTHTPPNPTAFNLFTFASVLKPSKSFEAPDHRPSQAAISPTSEIVIS
ncbi:hypothetical protein HK102_011107, partial [Quaeritorhiza haematococci]